MRQTRFSNLIKIRTWRVISISLLVSSIFVSCQNLENASLLQPVNLTCEYRDNPQGIDVLVPRLSWQIHANGIRGEKQTAFRILVASSPEKLKEGKADLWDSEKVPSGQSVNVSYDGQSLETGAECYWAVRIWWQSIYQFVIFKANNTLFQPVGRY